MLVIDDIKVISFDKFSFNQKQLIEYDDQVRKHMDFSLHHLFKRQFIEMA